MGVYVRHDVMGRKEGGVVDGSIGKEGEGRWGEAYREGRMEGWGMGVYVRHDLMGMRENHLS